MLSRLLGIRIFDVEVSSACNLRCRFCPRDEMKDIGMMTEETFSRFLETVPLKATDNVAFVGMGEPTLNPLLPSFVSRLKERHPGVTTWVTTNGTTLRTDTMRDLIDAGLDILDVSFNGLDRESYEDTMRGAKFSPTAAAIEDLAARLERDRVRTTLQINYVISDENRHREREIRAFWRSRGVRHFRVQRIHNRAGLVDVPGMASHRAGLRGKGCGVFGIVNFITWRGDVLYCCHDVRRELTFGNIHNEEWGVIAARKKQVQKYRKWPSMCERCTDPLRFDMRRTVDRKIISHLMGVGS
ncbi:radical SAM/SPASM domain-containing protein [Planctomycetota bacterium]